MDTQLVTEVPSQRPHGYVHPSWRERFPWLVQGTTGRGPEDGEPYDLGLFARGSPAAAVHRRWERIRTETGLFRAVHTRQPHGAAVRWHGAGPPGLLVSEPCDGHATDRPGILLGVTVADCVPAFVVDRGRRAVALLHAGWRGAAAGILERGVAVLGERVGSDPADLSLHLGPSICGRCYEVGPEVFRALGLEEPDGPAPVDLRAALAERAALCGLPREEITVSTLCTRCGAGDFFSHRGGDAGRQIGYLGIRA